MYFIICDLKILVYIIRYKSSPYIHSRFFTCLDVCALLHESKINSCMIAKAHIHIHTPPSNQILLIPLPLIPHTPYLKKKPNIGNKMIYIFVQGTSLHLVQDYSDELPYNNAYKYKQIRINVQILIPTYGCTHMQIWKRIYIVSL